MTKWWELRQTIALHFDPLKIPLWQMQHCDNEVSETLITADHCCALSIERRWSRLPSRAKRTLPSILPAAWRTAMVPSVGLRGLPSSHTTFNQYIQHYRHHSVPYVHIIMNAPSLLVDCGLPIHKYRKSPSDIIYLTIMCSRLQ